MAYEGKAAGLVKFPKNIETEAILSCSFYLGISCFAAWFRVSLLWYPNFWPQTEQQCIRSDSDRAIGKSVTARPLLYHSEDLNLFHHSYQ